MFDIDLCVDAWDFVKMCAHVCHYQREVAVRCSGVQLENFGDALSSKFEINIQSEFVSTAPHSFHTCVHCLTIVHCRKTDQRIRMCIVSMPEHSGTGTHANHTCLAVEKPANGPSTTAEFETREN